MQSEYKQIPSMNLFEEQILYRLWHHDVNECSFSVIGISCRLYQYDWYIQHQQRYKTPPELMLIYS
jgi:hypothetical protein